VTAIILPYLPDEPIDKFNILIPFNIWLLVIFISSIGFVGYFLQKHLGNKKSLSLTSILGSIVSSTATVVSIAEKSKNIKNTMLLSSVVMLSIVVMQLRIIIEIIVVSGSFIFSFIMPSVVMIIVAVFFFFYFHHLEKNTQDHKPVEISEELKSPFRLIPALKFAVLFVVVLYAVFFGQKYFGHIGGYFATALAALVDSDAIVLSNIETYKVLNTNMSLTANMIAIAVVVNTLVKLVYLYIFGKKALFKRVAPAILSISFIGLVTFLVF